MVDKTYSIFAKKDDKDNFKEYDSFEDIPHEDKYVKITGEEFINDGHFDLLSHNVWDIEIDCEAVDIGEKPFYDTCYEPCGFDVSNVYVSPELLKHLGLIGSALWLNNQDSILKAQMLADLDSNLHVLQINLDDHNGFDFSKHFTELESLGLASNHIYDETFFKVLPRKLTSLTLHGDMIVEPGWSKLLPDTLKSVFINGNRNYCDLEFDTCLGDGDNRKLLEETCYLSTNRQFYQMCNLMDERTDDKCNILSQEILQEIDPYLNKWCIYMCNIKDQDHDKFGLDNGIVCKFGYTNDIKNKLESLSYEIESIIGICCPPDQDIGNDLPEDAVIYAYSELLRNFISGDVSDIVFDNKLFTIPNMDTAYATHVICALGLKQFEMIKVAKMRQRIQN